MASERCVGIRRLRLRELHPDVTNILVIGLVIAKQRPRKFAEVKSNDCSRAVFNFTLRDSPSDYINATYWGSFDLLQQLNEKVHIGDTVTVLNPRVAIRKLNDYGEQFRPMVTSPFNLILSEHSSMEVNICNSTFSYLLNYPTKPIGGFVPLRDIVNNGSSMKDTFVDILGAVKWISEARTISVKSGENLLVCDIEVFDHTAPGMRITFWDSDFIKKISTWQPRYTVLFMTDLKVEYSDFDKSFIAKVTSRTIITENPESPEVSNLRKYARIAQIETSNIIEQILMSLPNVSTIQDIMSIEQVHERIKHLVNSDQRRNKHFTAVLLAYVTHFDLDGFGKLVDIKCSNCKFPLENQNSKCDNSDCSNHSLNFSQTCDFIYNIRMSVSDHTGTLKQCQLTPQAAERILGYDAKEFLKLKEEVKTDLKWEFLLENCEVRIAVFVLDKRRPIIKVLSCDRAKELEVAQKLPIY